MAATLTISVAEPGAQYLDKKSGKVTTSTAGHVWYTVTDQNGKSYTYGFDPKQQNSPISAGQVVDSDSTTYLNKYAVLQSTPITNDQANALVVSVFGDKEQSCIAA